MIELLRLSHRIRRDKRLTSHIGLTSRAFLVSKMYYSGEHDGSMENSIDRVSKRFGGNFQVEYVKNPLNLVKSKKKGGYNIVHLTAYGISVKKVKKNLDISKLMIVIGSEHVSPEYFQLSDYNVAITNQPISELSALSVFLHEVLDGKELDNRFRDAKVEIIPKERGKQIESR